METGRRIWRDIRGSEAVSLLLSIAMLLLIFITLISALIYVFQYYNASYICRRVVRSMEITGKYDPVETETLLEDLAGADHTLDIDVQTNYFSGDKIQLRETFTVVLRTSYPIKIWQGGNSPLVISLPIEVKVKGMSEIFWK